MNAASIPILITTPDRQIDPEVASWLWLHDNPVVHFSQPRFQSCQEEHKNRCVNIAAGRSAAMFIGLKEYPLADYFFFLDADVKPPLGAIQTLYRHQLPAVGGWFEARHGGWIGGRNTKEGFKLFEETLPGLTPTCLLSLGCTLVHRDFLGEPFDPGIDAFVKMANGSLCHLADSGAFSKRMTDEGHCLYLDGDVVASHQSKGVEYV